MWTDEQIFDLRVNFPLAPRTEPTLAEKDLKTGDAEQNAVRLLNRLDQL